MVRRLRQIPGFLLAAVAEDFIVTTILPLVVAFVVAVVLGIIVDLGAWSIFGVATASAITASGSFAILRALFAWVRVPVIELSHRPRSDGWLHLHVKNNRRTQRFVASVLSIENIEHKDAEVFPWQIKWRGWPDDPMADLIPIGEERILDLATAEPPRVGGSGPAARIMDGRIVPVLLEDGANWIRAVPDRVYPELR